MLPIEARQKEAEVNKWLLSILTNDLHAVPKQTTDRGICSRVESARPSLLYPTKLSSHFHPPGSRRRLPPTASACSNLACRMIPTARRDSLCFCCFCCFWQLSLGCWPSPPVQQPYSYCQALGSGRRPLQCWPDTPTAVRNRYPVIVSPSIAGRCPWHPACARHFSGASLVTPSFGQNYQNQSAMFPFCAVLSAMHIH